MPGLVEVWTPFRTNCLPWIVEGGSVMLPGLGISIAPMIEELKAFKQLDSGISLDDIHTDH